MGRAGEEILGEMIATGRARWRDPNGPVVGKGPPRPASVRWRLREDGAQHLEFVVDCPVDGAADATALAVPAGNGGDQVGTQLQVNGNGTIDGTRLAGGPTPTDNAGRLDVIRLSSPWYVDPSRGIVGPLDTGLPARAAEALCSAPPVPAGQEVRLAAALEGGFPDLAPLKPPALPPPERIARPVTPRLTLSVSKAPSRDWPSRSSWYRYSDGPDKATPIAWLSFEYGPTEILTGDPRPQPTVVHEGRLVQIVRDIPGERRAQRRFLELGLVPAPWWVKQDSGESIPSTARGTSPSTARGTAPAGRRELVTLPVDDPDDPPEAPWYGFLARTVPELRAQGWRVVIEPAFPVRLVHASEPVQATVREDKIDWFELDLGVVVDGERIDLTPVLIQMINSTGLGTGLARQGLSDSAEELSGLEDDPDPAEGLPDFDETGAEEAALSYVPLPDGRTLVIPSRRLRAMVAALRELFDAGVIGSGDTAIRFSGASASDLALVEELTTGDGIAWAGGERLRALGASLRSGNGIAHTEAPPWFAATLRPYQSRGVDWLQFLRSAGLGGVLADDMGLGKTVQTLAHLSIEKASGSADRPSLVVAPTSVTRLWRDEAARFAPDLKVLLLHDAERRARFDDVRDHDLVITTFPLLARDRAVLSAQEWHAVVLDEAQTIKNPEANVARAARELRARQRICLTGTPVENTLGDLWSLFSFATPGLLGDRRQFNARWRRPIERDGDADRKTRLARRVRPFLLRRTKADVAPELPAKTEIVETVEMEQAQRDLYESIRLAMHERVREAIAARGLARSHIIVLDALLKLRQACCDPRLLRLEAARTAHAGSAKFDRLLEMVPQLIQEGRHVLLFSQFTSMLALIEPAIREASIPYVLLTGDTRDRETPVREFQSGRVPLFLGSLKAGGLGLNLTAADTVIHYDPWWNPAVEQQAIDRAHRIGQDKPITVYRLVARESVEEKMELLKERKRELAAAIFDPDGGSPLDLTERDIEDLFGS